MTDDPTKLEKDAAMFADDDMATVFPPGKVMRTISLPDGTTFKVGEPEPVGKIPSRTEMTVLPADPDTKPVGWAVHMRNGGPVLLAPKGLVIQETLDQSVSKDGKQLDLSDEQSKAIAEVIDNEETYQITSINGIQIGDLLLVPTLFGYALANVTEVRAKERKAWARSSSCAFPLEFGGPDWDCWWCGLSMNLKGIKKMEISR